MATIAALALLSAASVGYAASEIADAAMHGDAAKLQSLLDQQVDVNAPQPDGATALHWAVYRDELAIAQLLIERGGDVAAANREGVPPLALAAVNGNAEMIELLLEAGADANSMLMHGETALMLAARTGSVAAIDVLVSHGAQVDARETLRGTTALMWAAAYTNADAVRALLVHGADFSAQSNVIPRGRRPYLAPSARSRIDAFAEGVGQAGRALPVDLDGTDDTGASDADFADVPENRPAAPGAAPAPANEEEFPEFERVERPRSGDPSPSAQGPRRGGEETTGTGEVVRQIEEWGGLTPLVFAAREGDLESARVLLDAGADVNQTTAYGWTALLAATQNRYYELGKFLLERGADPNIANMGGWNPLYIATDNRNIEGGDYPTRKPDMDHFEYIVLLLDHGADPHLRMNSSTETRTIFTHQWLYEEGATSFLRAAQSGDLVLMKLLLEHGADPNIPTYDNVTPLMVASGIGWVEGITFEWSPEQTLEVIKLLLELGADVNAKETLDYRTALMGAAHKGRTDVIDLLVAHGADLAARDIGSRDSIHSLAGVTWQAIDYADGLVRVGVQSAIAHPEAAALLRELMVDAALPVPPPDRTLESICITEICR
jgi:ankyrin